MQNIHSHAKPPGMAKNQEEEFQEHDTKRGHRKTYGIGKAGLSIANFQRDKIEEFRTLR